MNFNDIIGQEAVIGSLVNAIKKDRVGHAYVLTGAKGMGKRTVAGIFAAMLMCQMPGEYGPCGQCPSCMMYANGSNPDFHILGNDETSIGVDEIRKLQSDIIIRPLYSGRKVYLISNAENMTVQAQNCLLKILEEPPGYGVIILTASNYNALMETIRSRTVRLNFKKNTRDQVKQAIRTNLGESRNMDFVAAYADGVIGTALELAGSEEFYELREKAIELVLKLAREGKLVNVFQAYEFFEKNKSNIDALLDIMLLTYRDMMVYKNAQKENILINYDKKDIILSNVPRFTMQKLAQNIEEIETARRHIKQNANFQLSIEVMLMKLL